MITTTNLRKALLVPALLLVWASDARSQADCAYGYRIHIRDETGKTITNANIDVSGLSERDKLPTAFQKVFARDSYFVGFVMYGCSYPGQFELRVSAVGLQTYKRPITFTNGLVACELTLPPEVSAKKPNFEELATLWGKVSDQEGHPFTQAVVEATNADGRIYRTESTDLGYYQLDLPKGANTIRFINPKITSAVFENYQVEANGTLDVKVRRKKSKL